MRAFVLSNESKPLMPTSFARARMLINRGQAFIKKRVPFTIQLTRKAKEHRQPIRLKVDPGSKETGIALVIEGIKFARVIFLLVIQHRGVEVTAKLKTKHDQRRSRRSRNLRYRKPRFMNRASSRRKGLKLPSLLTRYLNHLTWAKRLMKLAPITSCTLEHVKFDTQKMDSPTIQGKEYQQGTLFEEEVRQYLLHRDNHQCRFCGGKTKDVNLTKEHNIPKCKGGSNRINNLCIACVTCNQDKAGRTLEEWLKELKASQKQIDIDRIDGVEAVIKGKAINKSNRHCAVMNQLRNELEKLYSTLFDDLELSTGAQTAFNRKQMRIAKHHSIDAAVAGKHGQHVTFDRNQQVLIAKSRQRNPRQMRANDEYGFPKRKPNGELEAVKVSRGKFGGTTFASGDFVKFTYTGKAKGIPQCRMAKTMTFRKTGSFKFRHDGHEFSVHWKKLTKLFSNDGYNYSFSTIEI